MPISSPNIDETPTGARRPEATKKPVDVEQAWRDETTRSIHDLQTSQGVTLAVLARVESRIARAGTAFIAFFLIALLPHLGPPTGWLAWGIAHQKETGAALAFLLVMNSIMPRGARPSEGLALAWWLFREYAAILDRKGWFGRFKVGVADYDKPDKPANSNGSP